MATTLFKDTTYSVYGLVEDIEQGEVALPDIQRPFVWGGAERSRARTDQSFCVPKTDIVAQGYDLSLNRYKEVIHDQVEHRPPLDIIADLERFESEIQQGLSDLKAML